MLKKKKNKYRKPLNDITNLFVKSLIQSPDTPPSFSRLQSGSSCVSPAGNRGFDQEGTLQIVEV